MRTMIRKFPVFFMFLIAGMSWAADEIKCNPDGAQIELNACARNEFEKADKELNQTYNAVLKKEAADLLFIAKFRQAQKAWILFRDADLDAWFACPDANVKVCWGSMYPMSYQSRKAELTRERTRHLKRLLKEGRGE